MRPGSLTRRWTCSERHLIPRRLPDDLRPGRTRLYRVVFYLTRSDGRDGAGRHTIYVYVSHRGKLGVWDVALVGTKP